MMHQLLQKKGTESASVHVIEKFDYICITYNV